MGQDFNLQPRASGDFHHPLPALSAILKLPIQESAAPSKRPGNPDPTSYMAKAQHSPRGVRLDGCVIPQSNATEFYRVHSRRGFGDLSIPIQASPAPLTYRTGLTERGLKHILRKLPAFIPCCQREEKITLIIGLLKAEYIPININFITVFIYYCCSIDVVTFNSPP